MTDKSTELLFDKFQVIECLKKDVCGAVYLSYHYFLEKKIILKTLDTDNIPEHSILDRFKREARILASLDHPNIIKVLDFGMYDQFFYISFEYFESKNLRRVIKENNLNNEDRKHLTIQLFKGLSEAHRHNIIHRDIKPENILVNSSRELKIADFGLAAITSEDIITNQYSIVGTPGYMSPEQLNGFKIDQRTDIFSTGIVLHELYTGVNPVIGKDVNETINNILNLNEDELELDSCGNEIGGLIRRLLKGNPDERINSADEVLGYFNIFEEHSVKEDSHKKNYLKYLWVPAIAIVLILLILYLKSNINSPGKMLYEVKADTTDKISQNILPQQQTVTAAEEEKKEKYKNEESKEEAKKIEDAVKDTGIDQVNLTNIEKPLTSDQPIVKKYGKLNIECFPWAVVYLNSVKIDTTPLKKDIVISEGYHTISLRHKDYPTYTANIYISSNKVNMLSVNLDTLVGYLNCKIYPWGEIFINGESKGTTPFNKPLRLPFGSYNISVKNSNYPEHIEKINIPKGKVIDYEYTFVK